MKFIAFSLYNILDNYAIKARLLDKTINFFGQDIDFQLIVSFKVAIHLCEFEKLFQIMGLNFKFNRSKEYWNMMDYLGSYSLTLNSILEYSSEDYNYFVNKIFINGSNVNYIGVEGNCSLVSFEVKKMAKIIMIMIHQVIHIYLFKLHMLFPYIKRKA